MNGAAVHSGGGGYLKNTPTCPCCPACWTISTDYYEAAQLDGAGKWQQFKCITLP